MTEGNVVVALRRKVRNLETNLLEWRRCTCTFTRDAQLVLELSDDDVDDVELADEDEQGRLRGKCRVVIDLATQLRRIEQKRKSKTRCEIEYQQQLPGAGGRSHSRLLVRTEELMASSAKHCQQFIDRVRAAERQGKRTQSIRLGSMLAANAAASDTLDSSSGATSPRDTVATRMPNAELKPSNFVSAANQVGNSSSMLALSQLSSHSTSSIATSKLLLSTTPLPQELFAQRLASIRATGTEPRVYTCSARVPEDDEVDDDDSFETRRKARMDRMLMSPTGAPRKRNSASMTAANLSRLRANQEDDDDNSSNRAELHILMRVEAALRQLEKENALAKEREHALAQEVQSLRDALRIKSAEKKHVESQFHHLLRETDEWKQVAQRAERTAAQLEDELLIAREEAQLLHSERVRLKHQNKELLTHVHRLDSLVYGRF